MTTRIFFFLLLFIMATNACEFASRQAAKTDWQVYLDGIGTYSSIRAVDLNQDGVLDIVMGAGAEENAASDTAVIALDGSSGALLWHASGENQFVGSAVFQDINADGVPDVFIGGRWSELVALDGRNGQALWRFLPQRLEPNPADSGWHSFTTPQLVPDQDQDGLKDLLISNGGDPFAPPGDPNRPAGKLVVLSSRDGNILAMAEMPDGKETYMSVVCKETAPDGDLTVLFGTGGETIGGSLFRTSLRKIMNGDISDATILATNENKGFIGSPVMVDITSDGIEDVVVNAVDGKMLAIDGATDSLIWEVHFPGTESYNSPAVGYFNGDGVPDFFTNFGIGTYPALPESMVFMVDGKQGKVEYQVKVQGYQYANPVVADLYGTGSDVAIINKGEVRRRNNKDQFYSYLVAFDFKNNRQFVMGDTLWGYNLASTPWIGDLDHDEGLDFIYSAVSYKSVALDRLIPEGMHVTRYRTGYRITKPIVWGAYLGSDYSNVFPNP